MSTWLIILAAGSVWGPAEYEKDGVRLLVKVVSNVYHWEITNLNAAPITQFEVPQHNCYLFKVPDGWEKEIDGNVFRAWTANDRHAIQTRQTKKFSFRVTSEGAVLGKVPAKITLNSGQVVRLDDVWGPVRIPRRAVLVVAGGIVVIVLGHAWLLSRREQPKHSASGV